MVQIAELFGYDTTKSFPMGAVNCKFATRTVMTGVVLAAIAAAIVGACMVAGAYGKFPIFNAKSLMPVGAICIATLPFILAVTTIIFCSTKDEN